MSGMSGCCSPAPGCKLPLASCPNPCCEVSSMSNGRVLAFSLLAMAAGALGARAQQAPAAEPSKPAAAKPEKEKEASKEVRIKQECGTLEEDFRRRAALYYLKGEKDPREAILKDIDPESASQVRRLIETDRSFKELDYHYLEKIKNCEQRILNRLRLDRFNGVEDLLEVVKEKQFPNSAAY